jgi:tetratricopeptide (TPR) repeat protein
LPGGVETPRAKLRFTTPIVLSSIIVDEFPGGKLVKIYILIAVLLLSGSVQAATLTVCPGRCDYSSVQAAINASHPGDTLRVYSGIYNENVNINKDLHLIYIDTGGGVHVKGVTSVGSADIFSVKLPEQDPGVMKYTAAYWLENAKKSYSKGSYEKALDYFNKSLWVDPLNVSVWYMKGITLEGLNRYDEAMYCINKIIEAYPKSAVAWNQKGIILYKLGSYDEAAKCFYRATEMDPNYAEAWHNKGAAIEALGDTTGANKAFSKAKELGYKG